MPVLDEILEACDKNDFSNFRRLFNTYIDDENTYVKFIMTGLLLIGRSIGI